MEDQRPYWDGVADSKTFTHPLDEGWLDAFVPRTARILDYGCGYGRTMAELAARGYADLVGMDFSSGMIERGRRAHPDMDLRVVAALPTAEPDASFDAVLLLAVMTSIPDARDQDRVMDEVRRLLRPGGVLYLSDMPLQADRRNRERYAEGAGRFGTWGIFETSDGAVVRHHDEGRLREMLEGFAPPATREVTLSTMNGNSATGIQVVARRV